eukprot:scaffold20551_cov60-Cyclotella_meneghiniana.AAC.1
MSSFHRASLLTYFFHATAITNNSMVADTPPTRQIQTGGNGPPTNSAPQKFQSCTVERYTARGTERYSCTVERYRAVQSGTHGGTAVQAIRRFNHAAAQLQRGDVLVNFAN